jgi:hypothetical protein
MEEVPSDLLEELKLEVYPNPNSGQFTIRTNQAGEYQLLNSVGQTVELFNLGGSGSFSKDFTGLIAGVYYVRNTSSFMIQRIVVID